MNQQPEVQMMNDRINSLEATVLRSTKAAESVSKSVNELLMEFKERDVRHEFERKANIELAEKVHGLTIVINDYIETKEPILARAKKVQDRWDSFWTSLSTNAGKIFVGIILFGIMVLLGLNPKDLFTK